MSDPAAQARLSVAAAVETLRALLDDGETLERVARAAQVVAEALKAGGKVWLFGNGGSAADAQHIAAELVGRFRLERRGFAAEALTVNTSALTAIGNDLGFEAIFARQLEAVARPGDVALGISTSGRSGNVVEGLRAARGVGARTIALTGRNPGAVGAAADEAVSVPADDVARIQECHILIGHVVCELVENLLVDRA